MSFLPQLPEEAVLSRGEAPLQLRYEDICQDGRMMTQALPGAIGSLWQSSLNSPGMNELVASGVVPILSQLWIEGEDERLHPGQPARCAGTASLGHTRQSDGGLHRIVLDLQVDVSATRGSVLGPRRAGDGEEVLAGRVHARYVFTRPFHGPGQRRVTRLQAEGFPEVPACEVPSIAFEAMLERDAALQELEAAAPCPPHAFSLQHCDSNQHVNSMVYPRLFEEAAQSHLLAEGHKPTLSRRVALRFRRPFFAGQRARIRLHSFAGARGLFASGDFRDEPAVGADGSDERSSHCQVAMSFS